MNYPIIIVNGSIEKEELKIFIDNPYEELIKFTIDINQKKIAIGVEMHADSEKVFIESGSSQEDIWGANLYHFGEKANLEFISLINISPLRNNKGMEIKDETLRSSIKQIVMDQIKLDYE